MQFNPNSAFCCVGSQWGQFPTCHMCLKIITDSRDVPVRDEDALIAVIIRMAAFPGSRLASRPPRHARLCRPCYDHLKRVKEGLITKSLLDRVRLLVAPWWSAPPPPPSNRGPLARPHSPPLCPGFVDTDVDPNIRRRLIRSLNAECVQRVERTISEYVELNIQLHNKLAAERAADEAAGKKEQAEEATAAPAPADVFPAAPTRRRQPSAPVPPSDQAPTPRASTSPTPQHLGGIDRLPYDAPAATPTSGGLDSLGQATNPPSKQVSGPPPFVPQRQEQRRLLKPTPLRGNGSAALQQQQPAPPPPMLAIAHAQLAAAAASVGPFDVSGQPLGLPPPARVSDHSQRQQHVAIQPPAAIVGGPMPPPLPLGPPPAQPGTGGEQPPQYSPRSTLQYSPRSTMNSSPRNTMTSLPRDTLTSELGEDESIYGFKHPPSYPSAAAIHAALAAHAVATVQAHPQQQGEDDTAAAAALLGHLASASYQAATQHLQTQSPPPQHQSAVAALEGRIDPQHYPTTI